jgi:CPA1 family monovalent cation:H+ antiporter
MMHEVYAAQRRSLISLRDDGTIATDVMRRLEREVDLEESRLDS